MQRTSAAAHATMIGSVSTCGRASICGVSKTIAATTISSAGVGANSRSRQRVKNFYADFNARLADVPFVAGDEFSVADITAVVTVDFATRAAGLPIGDEHPALQRWYDVVSARASMGA